MSIAHLLSIVPAPSTPSATGSKRDWIEIERKLATKFPADYKDYIESYGSGSFGNWVTVYNPFSKNGNIELLKQTERILAIYNESRRDFPQYEPPYSAFPESPGLLPWGVWGGGGSLFWLTDEDPDCWQVVVYSKSGSYELYAVTMTEFLAQWLEGSIVSKLLPADCLQDLRIFVQEST